MATMIHLADGMVQTITDAQKDLRKSADFIKSAIDTGRKAMAAAALELAATHESGRYVATLKAADVAEVNADGRKTAWAKFYADYCGLDKVEASRLLSQGRTILSLQDAGLENAADFPADTLRAFRKVAVAAGDGSAADWSAGLSAAKKLKSEGQAVNGPNLRSLVENDGGSNTPTAQVVDLSGMLRQIATAIENDTPVVLGTTSVSDLDTVIAFLQSRRPAAVEAETEAAAAAAAADETDETDEN